MGNVNMFKPAQRKKAKLRLALCGISNSGKSFGSLLIARGLIGDAEHKVAAIDTENGSLSLYAHPEIIKNGVVYKMPQFDVIELNAPYTPLNYIQAIKNAEENGYEVIIIDSLTHAWAGSGGLLEQADKKTAASTHKNSYVSWKDITPQHNKLIEAILTSKCHIIASMRCKVDWVIEENEKGKKAPKKVGLAPVQRAGMDYEFTVVFDINNEHYAVPSKDRTSLFDGNTPDFLSEETGKQLLEWLNKGADEPVATPAPTQPANNEDFNKELSSVIDILNAAESMEELKLAYENQTTKYKGNKPMYDKIVMEKERRKLEIIKTSKGV